MPDWVIGWPIGAMGIRAITSSGLLCYPSYYVIRASRTTVAKPRAHTHTHTHYKQFGGAGIPCEAPVIVYKYINVHLYVYIYAVQVGERASTKTHGRTGKHWREGKHADRHTGAWAHRCTRVRTREQRLERGTRGVRMERGRDRWTRGTDGRTRAQGAEAGTDG